MIVASYVFTIDLDISLSVDVGYLSMLITFLVSIYMCLKENIRLESYMPCCIFLSD